MGATVSRMGTLTVTNRRRKDLYAVVRQRAATLFDAPLLHPPVLHPPVRDPAPPTGPPAPAPAPEAAAQEPPSPVPRPSAVSRLATWLFVRCGVELKTVAALGMVLLAAAGFAVHHFWTGRPHTVAVPPATRAAVPRPSPGPPPAVAAKARLVVDIAGKVRNPGLRKLPSGSRVADALRAAGGAVPGADTSALNLARLLADGEQILVGAPAPLPSGTSPSGPSAPVSLGTATLDQLETLPGVGPVLAQHILDYRARHGGFASIDQLNDVTGIGDRRFADLKPLVRP
jgi:competence protein ComEA